MPVNEKEIRDLEKSLLAWIKETTDEEQKNARRLAFFTITDAYERDLKKLDLRNIGIDSIDSIFENILQLNYVKWIDLANNKLENIPQTIWKLNNLEHVDLSNNELREFPEIPKGITVDRKLYINLEYNPEFTIPPSILKRAPNLHIAEDRKPPTSYTNIAAASDDHTHVNANPSSNKKQKTSATRLNGNSALIPQSITRD